MFLRFSRLSLCFEHHSVGNSLKMLFWTGHSTIPCLQVYLPLVKDPIHGCFVTVIVSEYLSNNQSCWFTEIWQVIFVRQSGSTSKIQLILFPSLTSAAMAQSGLSRRGGGGNTTIILTVILFYVQKEKGAEDNQVRERK